MKSNKAVINLDKLRVGVIFFSMIVFTVFLGFVAEILPELQSSSEDVSDNDAPLTNLFSPQNPVIMVMIVGSIVLFVILILGGRELFRGRRR